MISYFQKEIFYFILFTTFWSLMYFIINFYNYNYTYPMRQFITILSGYPSLFFLYAAVFISNAVFNKNAIFQKTSY